MSDNVEVTWNWLFGYDPPYAMSLEVLKALGSSHEAVHMSSLLAVLEQF